MLNPGRKPDAAVWYRHWLEHAGAALVALGVTTFLCVGTVATALYRTARYERSGFVGDLYRSLSSTLEPAQLIPLGAHAGMATVAAVCLPLFLHGTGLRTNDLRPGHPSLYYTLTLPASRARLIWTRFALACASATALQAFMLGVNASALWLFGWEVPLGAMATASALSTLLLVTIVAVFGLINVWDERVLLWIFPLVGLAFLSAVFDRPTRLALPLTLSWGGIAAMGVVIGGSLALATLIARRREF